MKRYKKHKQYRLPYYNYAGSGYYFVTMCSYNREHIFGEINNGSMHLSPIGIIAESFWKKIPEHFPFLSNDVFVVMPNHIHGLVCIEHSTANHSIDEKVLQPQKNSLSIAIRNYKAAVTKEVKILHPDIQVWQSRFYDRIVRNEKELNAVRQYIINNPTQWEADRNNPENLMM